MIKKDNYRISKKVHHHDLSYSTTIAALFSVVLILTGAGIGLPLLQQQQQYAYASSQAQAQAPPSSFTQAQRPSIQAQSLISIYCNM